MGDEEQADWINRQRFSEPLLLEGAHLKIGQFAAPVGPRRTLAEADHLGRATIQEIAPDDNIQPTILLVGRLGVPSGALPLAEVLT